MAKDEAVGRPKEGDPEEGDPEDSVLEEGDPEDCDPEEGVPVDCDPEEGVPQGVATARLRFLAVDVEDGDAVDDAAVDEDDD